MNRAPQRRRPIVGVIGSGRAPHEERAVLVGAWLATQGVHLLTGGGGGVMAAVSRAFAAVADRQGLVIGILPGAIGPEGFVPASGYPNPWVEVPIYTHLPLSGRRGTAPMSRNHLNMLSSTVIIALPGGHGTASEVTLALAYGRPLVAYIAHRTDIVALPGEAYVESDWRRVQTFVQAHLSASARP